MQPSTSFEVLVGVIIALIGLVVSDVYTGWTKSRLKVLIDKPPRDEAPEAVQTPDGTRTMIFRIWLRVRNGGIRPGRVARVEVNPLSTRHFANPVVTSFDQRDIRAFQTREIALTIRVVDRFDRPDPRSEFQIALYDENARHIGGMRFDYGMGPPPADPIGSPPRPR